MSLLLIRKYMTKHQKDLDITHTLTRAILCHHLKNDVPLQLYADLRPVSAEVASCSGPDLHYSHYRHLCRLLLIQNRSNYRFCFFFQERETEERQTIYSCYKKKA